MTEEHDGGMQGPFLVIHRTSGQVVTDWESVRDAWFSMDTMNDTSERDGEGRPYRLAVWVKDAR